MYYYLHYTSSNFSGLGCVPLEEGRWVCRQGENNTGIWVIDKSFNEFELADAMYDVSEVDGTDNDCPHYCAVMDALIPIWKREQTAMSFTVDGIDYAFEVKTFEAQAV